MTQENLIEEQLIIAETENDSDEYTEPAEDEGNDTEGDEEADFEEGDDTEADGEAEEGEEETE